MENVDDVCLEGDPLPCRTAGDGRWPMAVVSATMADAIEGPGVEGAADEGLR